MAESLRKVIGVEVEPRSNSRTVRIKLTLDNNEVFAADLPLPTATRLTDQLVDAEFYERCPVGLLQLLEDASASHRAI
ncbi:MAG: hypothetical protein ACREKL_11475 [Chthoniobacterales bacterium]